MAKAKEALIKAKFSFEKNGYTWKEGKHYPLVMGATGFTLKTENGVLEGMYIEMDEAVQNFDIPSRHYL